MDFNLGGIQGWREIQNALTDDDEVRSNGVSVGVAVSKVVHVTCTCPCFCRHFSISSQQAAGPLRPTVVEVS